MTMRAPVRRAPERSEAPPSDLWDTSVCDTLIEQLSALRAAMLLREAEMHRSLTAVLPAHRDSARNLIHYLELRAVDLRTLQDQLAWLGLSSLGRSESHVLANLDKVLGLLHRLAGRTWQDRSAQEPLGQHGGRALLQHNTVSLLGDQPAQRDTRIMVTLPSEAAHDVGLVRKLVEAGMDIARINCAHDGPDQWRAMADQVRKVTK
ncbi:MAG: pyruvate kinase, partial [Rhodoferax sp.]|nr:pyruvate kinase [Rhodoferax sp.]